MEIKLLDNIYLKEDNTFDLDSALKYSAKNCRSLLFRRYFDSLLNEDEENN